jgi:thiol:disulfide interchange protein
VNWVPLAEAEQRALAANKLLLYDFTAEWCGPCHQLDAVVFRDERLAAMINERFIAVRVTDRQREDGRNTPVVDQLQQRYSVKGFPTLVFTNARGEALARMDGFAGPDAFERTVRSIPG